MTDRCNGIFTIQVPPKSEPTICHRCAFCADSGLHAAECEATERIDYLSGVRTRKLCRDVNNQGVCRAFMVKAASDKLTDEELLANSADADHYTLCDLSEFVDDDDWDCDTEEFDEEFIEDFGNPYQARDWVAKVKINPDLTSGADHSIGPNAVTDVNGRKWVKFTAASLAYCDMFYLQEHNEGDEIFAHLHGDELRFDSVTMIKKYRRGLDKGAAPELAKIGRNPVQYGTVMVTFYENCRGNQKASVGDTNGIVWQKLLPHTKNDHGYVCRLGEEEKPIVAELTNGWLIFTEESHWDTYVAHTRGVGEGDDEK